jgi:hypothetical protein
MKLDKNGKLARFYKWSYREVYLPTNFCSYFWALLLAAFLFPITWLSYPLDCWSLTERVWKSFCVFMGLVGTAFYISLWIESPFKTGAVTFLVLVALVLLIAVIGGGVWCLERWDSRQPKPTVISEVFEVVRGQVEAVKENYCPKIEWD